MKATNLLPLLATAAAAAMLCRAAAAQQNQEVQVQATRTVNAQLAGRNRYGVPILDLSLGYRVNLADLDLSKSSGAVEAERRVKVAAARACKEIGHQYPSASPSDKDCAKAATDEAMPKIRELIAAAQAAGRRG
jgi:UrcA family protein